MKFKTHYFATSLNASSAITSAMYLGNHTGTLFHWIHVDCILLQI